MEHESQGYTTIDRCPRNNTHKVKKLVKGNGYSNSNNKVAEKHTARILQKVLEVQGNLLLLDLKKINPLLKQCVT